MTEFGNTVSHVGTSKKSFSHYDISQTTLICLSFGSSLSTLSVCVCDSLTLTLCARATHARLSGACGCVSGREGPETETEMI